MITALWQKIKAKLMNPKFEGKNEQKNWCGTCRDEREKRTEEQKESKNNEDEKG